MLSLRELMRAAAVVRAKLATTRIDRIVQPDDWTVAMAFSDRDRNLNLLLSCRGDSARLCAVDAMPRPAEGMPSSFAQYLRAHLLRARFAGVDVPEQDRQVSLRLVTPENGYELILSIMGARSNIYVLNSGRRLVHSMRPLETTRRELRIGEVWSETRAGLPAGGADRWAEVPDDEYLQAIGREFERIEQAKEFETLARRIETALTKEEHFLARKAANLLEDLGEARQAEEYRHKGELLKGALHTIHLGQETVVVTDYRTGDPLAIAVDPKLTPAQNLEAYFQKYQKQVRGIAAIEEQLKAVQQRQQEIDALHDKARTLSTSQPLVIEDLKRLEMEPGMRRLLSRYLPARRRAVTRPVHTKSDVPRKLMPKRYRGEHGLEIWVGRSDEGNDYLTTRLARGNDLFFHLEGYPGSHVVLRTDGKTDAPPEAVLDAAELAVHFSKMKEASRAEVHVTPIKNVKKPKGAKPGLVYVLRWKSVHLRRDPKRLRNILATRLDD
jgi:predicted ribosome quality control (RQC) complex YloA/Tae2 family protein